MMSGNDANNSFVQNTADVWSLSSRSAVEHGEDSPSPMPSLVNLTLHLHRDSIGSMGSSIDSNSTGSLNSLSENNSSDQTPTESPECPRQSVGQTQQPSSGQTSITLPESLPPSLPPVGHSLDSKDCPSSDNNHNILEEPKFIVDLKPNLNKEEEGMRYEPKNSLDRSGNLRPNDLSDPNIQISQLPTGANGFSRATTNSTNSIPDPNNWTEDTMVRDLPQNIQDDILMLHLDPEMICVNNWRHIASMNGIHNKLIELLKHKESPTKAMFWLPQFLRYTVKQFLQDLGTIKRYDCFEVIVDELKKNSF